ncbi:MAG: efflux RND transporter periplasmic adaptor subunit [Gemmataceae bacterium]
MTHADGCFGGRCPDRVYPNRSGRDLARHGERGPRRAGDGAAIEKTVHRVLERPAQNVEAYQQTPLVAKLAGYVGKLNVDIGDRVNAGQVLVELTIPELDVELKQKDALVRQAEAEGQQAVKALAAAEAGLKSAEAVVRQYESTRTRARAEQTRARSQSERLTRAGSAGVVDPESAAEARFGAEAAQAGVDEADAKIRAAEALRTEAAARRDKAAADLDAARARVDVAAANRDHTRALLDYTHIRAPFKGVVTKRQVDVGHFVQPAGGGKGEPLLTVERIDRMRVWLPVPEQEALWLALDRHAGGKIPVLIRGDGLGGRALRGTLARSAFALDPRTRTLRAEVDLPNPDELLHPGMYVHASIELEATGWTLPASAVQKRDGAVQCVVLDAGKAVPLPLLIGLESDGVVQVLKKQKRGGDGWDELTGTEEVVARP